VIVVSRKSIPGVVLVGMLLLLACSSSAFAESPWWHLNSGSTPAYLQSGHGRDEVQEVTVRATGGVFYLVENSPHFNFAFFKWDATHEEVQAGLEGIYGSGNVRVSGGPGDGKGTAPYRIMWPGQRVAPLQTGELLNVLLTCGTPEEEEKHVCRKESSLSEVSKGRSDGQIVVSAVNLGDTTVNAEAQPVTVTDKLPPGLKAVGVEGVANEERLDGAQTNLECSVGLLSCTFTGGAGGKAKGVPPYGQIVMVLAVDLQPGAKTGETNEATVTGGGTKTVSVKRPITVSADPVPFGVNTYEMTPEEEGGGVDAQAGSHPFQLTTTLFLNESVDEEGGKPVAMAKDLHFKLPPGLIGNPTPFPQCTIANFLVASVEPACSPQTVVGVARVTVTGVEIIGRPITLFSPLYNLEPSVGEPARFGFAPIEGTNVVLDTAVRTGGDYGVTVNVNNITQSAEFVSSEVTFWGVPGDPRHDNARGFGCMNAARELHKNSETCNPLEANHPPPLLSLPTSCLGQLHTSVEADSWKQQGSFQSFPNTDQMPALDGCNRLQFNPSIEVAPDGQAGSTPTGLAVSVHVPQDVSLNATGLSEADVKNTTVALPAGVAINPAGADGLQACSEEQISLSVNAVPACPDASKVGVVRIKTPLLPNELVGAAYLASQNTNPFGSLVALYVFVEDPMSGSRVKLAGEVVPDPVTGQLVSTFKNTPQLPFETFELHFFGGNRAPLSTPGLCGAYTTTASIAP